MSVILLVRIFELILLINSPLPVIVFAFMLQNTFLLQSRKVTFDGTLAHRQSLRHLFAGDCRRLFDEIEYFLLTLSEFRLRHVSVMVSDIRGVGRGKDDGLKLSRSRFEHRLQFFFISFQGFGLITNACESATSFLHIVKLSLEFAKFVFHNDRRSKTSFLYYKTARSPLRANKRCCKDMK